MNTNEAKKTLVFVLAALVLAVCAFLARRPMSSANTLPPQGDEFYPNWTEATAAGSLEVVEYDSKAAKTNRFQVVRDGQTWKIPTHFNYPADAETRLAKTAGSVIGLKQDQYVTTNDKEHAEMGVLSPEESIETTADDAVGKLVRIKKAADGEVLAEYIVGKPVANRDGFRYVRTPGKKQVYAVKVNADISTKFADWIETNLLKIDTNKIRQITFNHNRIDLSKINGPVAEFRQVLSDGGSFILKKGPDSSWIMDGGAPLTADQEIDSSKTSSLSSALGDVKIVGIRTKPTRLSSFLQSSDLTTPIFVPVAKISDEWIKSIAANPQPLSIGEESLKQGLREPTGFYVIETDKPKSNNPKQPPAFDLLPSQSTVQVGTEEGVVYTLFFGEPYFAEGDELTSGKADAKKADEKKADEKKADEKKADEAKPEEKKEESRFLFVAAHFDPSLVSPPPPPAPVLPGDEELVFEDPFQGGYMKEHPLADIRQKNEEAARKTAEEAQKNHDKKLEDYKKKVADLNGRFGNWYYLTRGDSFKSISLRRDELIKPKDKTPPGGAPGAGPAGFGGPGGPGLGSIPGLEGHP